MRKRSENGLFAGSRAMKALLNTAGIAELT